MFDFSIYWKYLEIIIPTDFHIFERGSYTTNQISVSNDSHFHGGKRTCYLYINPIYNPNVPGVAGGQSIPNLLHAP